MTATKTQPEIDARLLEQPVTYEPFDAFPDGGGGECVFLGRTRIEHHEQYGRLVELSYEAFTPLALKTLSDLAGEAVERFGCLAVRLHHAIGIVPPGQASVLVQVVCGHRAEAFEACRFLIDALKLRVPIWKREVWADGSSWSTGSPVEVEPQQ